MASGPRARAPLLSSMSSSPRAGEASPTLRLFLNSCGTSTSYMLLGCTSWVFPFRWAPPKRPLNQAPFPQRGHPAPTTLPERASLVCGLRKAQRPSSPFKSQLYPNNTPRPWLGDKERCQRAFPSLIWFAEHSGSEPVVGRMT